MIRLGYLVEEEGMTYLADIDPDNLLTPLQAASCTYRIALGPRAGHKVLSLRTVPGPPEKTGDDAAHHAHGSPAHMGWARLLKRVFDIDLEHCPQCGGEFKIIAAIEEPAVIVRILTHLGLPARAPPRSPARPTLACGGQRASKSAPTGQRRDRRIHAVGRLHPILRDSPLLGPGDTVAAWGKRWFEFPIRKSCAACLS